MLWLKVPLISKLIVPCGAVGVSITPPSVAVKVTLVFNGALFTGDPTTVTVGVSALTVTLVVPVATANVASPL